MEQKVYQQRRRRMVVEQLIARGIEDEIVLAAMESIPRHLFVPESMQRWAYEDCALPIDCGQTISQPYMVALMTVLLRLTDGNSLLEIGTGSGYQAAVAARIAAEVWSIERIEALSRRADEVLADIHVENVHLIVGDGCRGLPEHSPFDAVVVTAAAAGLPAALLEQLADGGRLVAPIGSPGRPQTLTVFERHGRRVAERHEILCRFVPLIPDARPRAKDQPAGV